MMLFCFAIRFERRGGIVLFTLLESGTMMLPGGSWVPIRAILSFPSVCMFCTCYLNFLFRLRSRFFLNDR